MKSEGSVTSPQDRPQPRCSLGSSSGLHYGSFANSLASLTPRAVEKPAISPRRAYMAVAVLCYINLLNYMERYTIAGWMIFCVHMTTIAVNKHYLLLLICWGLHIHCLYCHLGVLSKIQTSFDISDSTAGLLQTGIMMHLLDRHTHTPSL